MFYYWYLYMQFLIEYISPGDQFFSFKEYMTLMTRIGGILIIMLEFNNSGIIRSQKLSQTAFYNEKTCVITIYLRFYSRFKIWLA